MNQQSNTADQIGQIFDNMFKAASEPFNRLFPLAAIWLKTPVKTSLERKLRITTDDLICIKDGELVDCNDLPTHKIKMLHGNLSDTLFSITVENLSTNEISIVKL